MTDTTAAAAAAGAAVPATTANGSKAHEPVAAPAADAAAADKASDGASEPFPAMVPMLKVRDARGALAFYEKALRTEVKAKFDSENGLIMHSYLRSPLGGGFHFCVEDHGAMPDLEKFANVHAAPEGATHASAVYMYVTLKEKGACDEAVERMREAGATVTMEPKKVFWGPRLGKCLDPYGVAWDFAETLSDSGAAAAADTKEAAPATDGDAMEAEPKKQDETDAAAAPAPAEE